jgi:hypothetical protein
VQDPVLEVEEVLEEAELHWAVLEVQDPVPEAEEVPEEAVQRPRAVGVPEVAVPPIAPAAKGVEVLGEEGMMREEQKLRREPLIVAWPLSQPPPFSP